MRFCHLYATIAIPDMAACTTQLMLYSCINSLGWSESSKSCNTAELNDEQREAWGRSVGARRVTCTREVRAASPKKRCAGLLRKGPHVVFSGLLMV
jgi:hypothetical protein